MLDTHGQQPPCPQLLRGTIFIQIGELDFLWPGDITAMAGDGKAAFFELIGFFTCPDDLRVGHFQRLRRLFIIAAIHDDNTAGDTDLRRSKTDPRRVIHCLEHVIHQLTDIRINSSNRLGLAAQHRVGQNDNRSNGHGGKLTCS